MFRNNLFVVLFGLASVTNSIASQNQWRGLIDSQDVSCMSDIAILKPDFLKWGAVYFATGHDYVYLLWPASGYLRWHLFKESTASIADKNSKRITRLEEFVLVKAASTCDKLDLVYLSRPPFINAIPKKEDLQVLHLQATVTEGGQEPGKGEFSEAAFIAFGLKANIAQYSGKKVQYKDEVFFERTDKIKQRIAKKLVAPEDMDTEALDSIARDVCDSLGLHGWSQSLIPECPKMLSGEPSLLDPLKNDP